MLTGFNGHFNMGSMFRLTYVLDIGGNTGTYIPK